MLQKYCERRLEKQEYFPGPQKVNELEQEEVSPLLVQLMSSLRKPRKVTTDVKVITLASMLTYYAASSATTTSINLGMYLHGLSCIVAKS